ncbi:unnamed protein product [Caenorhabditis auriculariae]|uniref:EGF-like domain-containing protein n=1 Tax=Caenorhabditis auriculariae TaxID=2777116 RepID=A0A8S1H116_9PELO|nr:unnamed protein product [Caenorhabditis auriculariae]
MYALSRMYFINSLEFLSSCLSTKCVNGGICANVTGGHRCECAAPYHGPFCQFDGNEHTYEWSSIEVTVFLFVIVMVLCAVAVVCCASSSRMGFYISVPNKLYNRWEEEEELCDESEPGEYLPMANVNKGIVTSRTRETVIDDYEESSILQL